MDRNEFSGTWILVSRRDNEDNDTDMTGLDLFDKEGNLVRHYEISQPEFEAIWFDDAGKKCYQLGIRERTEEERLEFDYDSRYKDTSVFPGQYDPVNKTYDLIDPGRYEILPDGRLHTVQENGDYYCEEYWIRATADNAELLLLVNSIAGSTLQDFRDILP